MGLNRIQAHGAVENRALQRVLERMGVQYGGKKNGTDSTEGVKKLTLFRHGTVLRPIIPLMSVPSGN
jgi:RimJ/RimL family protein N-acetyltransferase